MPFKDVDTKLAFPALEQSIEQWWKERGIIKQALDSGDTSRPFVFFEGPPTANGRPGVHHIESRATKDIIIRYRRMRGQHVIGARGGWDTHGLPVEIEVEKELGFKGKPDIEKYGIAEFNKACKASVQRYIAEWERMTDRIAFWIDMENPYSTYDNSYIESLWWIMKSYWDNGLLFRDYKVTMHCPRCGTSLSDHEVALGFEDDVDDPSVWLRFRHQLSGHALDEQLAGAAFVAWTTTPWTLPANVALAVNPGAAYVLVALTPQPPLPGAGAGEQGGEGERLILAEALATPVLGEGSYTVLATFDGAALRDVRYERLFDGVPGAGDKPDLEQAYRVVVDDFVSLEDGTGIVHIAPAYGDLEIGRKYNLPTLFSVDLAGHTMSQFDALGFGGLFFKQADPLISSNLKQRGLLFRSGRVKHSYPFCWRCKTPLLYYAKPSWYIRTTARKEQLLANNEQIDWVPEHIKAGRFGNWLANNVDWALSRERYWGTPLPIWISEDGAHMECLGSVAELEQKVGRSLQELDLHRPYVDEITWPRPDAAHPGCGRLLVRLGRDAGGAVALSIREPGAVRKSRPGRLYLRGDRPDPRLVLHAARCLDAAVRPAGLPACDLPGPYSRCQGREDVEVARQCSRSLDAAGELWRRRNALVYVRLGAALQPAPLCARAGRRGAAPVPADAVEHICVLCDVRQP